MNKLLELYHIRFGNAVKRQGDGYNGPCPLCGGEPGKSDRFMVWDYKKDNLSKVCTENSIWGVYNCRQCGATGDTLSYLINIDGLTFKEALAELGITPHFSKYRKTRKAPKFRDKAEYTPRERELPKETWQDFAKKLQEKAIQDIQLSKEAKKYLNARGISDEMILAYKLGYLPGENRKQGIFRMRSSLGLEPKEKDGKTSNRIFIPRGITIPSYWENELVSLRIRRPKADILPTPNGYTPPKYMELEGSAKMPFILLPEPCDDLSCYAVVEAELDAILIHACMNRKIGVIALRSNQNKPCPVTHELIKACPRILFAMDFEESNAGIAAMDFWEETYPQLKRWPVPEGKDPGEAFGLGIDIACWINAGLPKTFKQKQENGKSKACTSHEGIISEKQTLNKQNAEIGHLDASQTGFNSIGGEGKILLYLYKFWGIEKYKYKFDGTGFVGKNTAFCVDENKEEMQTIQIYTIERFLENNEVMAWWKKHKNIWISFEHIENALKKEGLL